MATNGLVVTVYKDTTGALAKLVKVEQGMGVVYRSNDDTSGAAASSAVRVSFQAALGTTYAIQVDALGDRGGEYHVDWKLGAGDGEGVHIHHENLNTHTHTHTHIYAHTHTHSHIHTYSHIHTHTHSHSHSHTHKTCKHGEAQPVCCARHVHHHCVQHTSTTDLSMFASRTVNP